MRSIKMSCRPRLFNHHGLMVWACRIATTRGRVILTSPAASTSSNCPRGLDFIRKGIKNRCFSPPFCLWDHRERLRQSEFELDDTNMHLDILQEQKMGFENWHCLFRGKKQKNSKGFHCFCCFSETSQHPSGISK